jgi:hypothetical protein
MIERSKIRKAGAFGAAVAVASGALVLGAGTANAASDPGFGKLSAPKTVKAGQTFVLKCKLKSKQLVGRCGRLPAGQGRYRQRAPDPG